MSPIPPTDAAPAPPPPADVPPQSPDWRPSRRALLLAATAFAAGLILFALVWFGDRDESFYTVEPVARPDTASEFEPLPAPLPAERARGASGLDETATDERAASESRPRIVEPPQPPVPPAPVQAPVPFPPTAPIATGTASEPIALHMPAPQYPRQALRRGIEGTVLVRVDVGPDGVPTSVGLVRSSRSRELDRAALEAVRRWRFDPARIDGHPTVGSVVIPIEFNLGRR